MELEGSSINNSTSKKSISPSFNCQAILDSLNGRYEEGAAKYIVLIDNYIDESVLTLLSERKSKGTVTTLNAKFQKKIMKLTIFDYLSKMGLKVRRCSEKIVMSYGDVGFGLSVVDC